MSQFLDLKLILTKIFSKLPDGLILDNNLEDSSSLIKSIWSPPNYNLLGMYGRVKLSRMSWHNENLSSNFVSETNKVSILVHITPVSISKSLLIGLIFQMAIMIRLFFFFFHISFKVLFFSLLLWISFILLSNGRFAWLMKELKISENQNLKS